MPTATCTHGLRGAADDNCARCSTAAGAGPLFRAARQRREAQEWTRVGRTVTTMGGLARTLWTAAIFAPTVFGLWELAALHQPVGVLGLFISMLTGYVFLPEVWGRGRR